MADEIVGRLGTEIFLDDTGVSQKAQQIAKNFADVGLSMEVLTGKSVTLNSSFQLIDSSTGRFISTQQAQLLATNDAAESIRGKASAEQRAATVSENSAAVADKVAAAWQVQQQAANVSAEAIRQKAFAEQRAAQESRNSSTVSERLRRFYERQAAAAREAAAGSSTLETSLRGSNARMVGSVTASLDAQQAVTGLGRAIQGSTNSFQGAIPGLLSFVRNIQAVKLRSEQAGTSIKTNLVNALKGGGALAIALTAAGIAMELFRDQTEDTEDSVEDLVSSLIKLESVGGVGFNLETITRAVDLQKEFVKEATAALQAIEALGPASMTVNTSFIQSTKAAQEGLKAVQDEVQASKDLLTGLEKVLSAEQNRIGIKERLLAVEAEDLDLTKEQEKVERERLRDAEKFSREQERVATALVKQLDAQNRFIDKFAEGLTLTTAGVRTVSQEFDALFDRLIARGKDLEFRPDFKIETGGAFEEDLFGEIGAGLIRLQRATESGLIPVFDALRARASILRDGLLDLSDAGDSTGMKILEDDLKRVNTALLAIDVSNAFIQPFAQGLANIAVRIGSVNDLLKDMKLLVRDVVAELIKAGLVKLASQALAAVAGGLFAGPAGAAAGAAAASAVTGAIGGRTLDREPVRNVISLSPSLSTPPRVIGRTLAGSDPALQTLGRAPVGSRVSGPINVGTIEVIQRGQDLVQVIQLTQDIDDA